MQTPRVGMRRRRLIIKQRAKTISALFYFRLLVLFALYLFPFTLAADLFGRISFGGPEFQLFGITVNVTRELLLLGTLVLESPIYLGVCDYMLALDRETPKPLVSVFSWYSEGPRVKEGLRYSLFNIVLHVILFPLQRLPMLWAAGHMEEYSNAAAAVMEAARAGTEADMSVVDTVTRLSGQITACEGIVLLATVITMWFSPLPYLLAEDPGNGSFFRKVLESMTVMRGHLIEYCIFCVSFAGWYLLASLFGQYMCILFYPYIHIAQAIFLNRLILARRRMDAPPPETPDEGKSENPENQ